MAGKIDQSWESVYQNLQEKTGKSIDQWVEIARGTGISKHKELVTFLQNEYGLTYGYANSIALNAFDKGKVGETSEDDLVREQYAGEKANLRPIYEALIQQVSNFGSDVEVSPKRTYVSLRRKKQFALVQPTTKTRLDLGIVLKGVEPAGRLEAAGSFNSMVTHRVRVDDLSAIDTELITWLLQAYNAA